MSVDRHWQGLRFVYGGSKQKVLAQAGPQSPSLAEALLTPAIKEVVTTDNARFGYMEWPSVKPNQGPGVGWNTLRTLDAIAKRYEFENFKNEDAPLLPEHSLAPVWLSQWERQLGAAAQTPAACGARCGVEPAR